jgi:predicted GNAT superfamily acetyltransferase
VDVEVAGLAGVADAHALARVFREIWAAGPAEAPMSAELLWALAEHGGYAAVARDGSGAVVGGSAGFAGLPGPVLHSHITGVLPSLQGSGAGFRLKQHQREWALARGIDLVTWTFDPLVRRNGWFNLVKLGAVVTGYAERYYGEMADGVNAGDESDRCLVEWRLRDAPPALGAPPGPGDVVLCLVPEDIVEIRRRDPALARAWRLAVRETMAPALSTGYVARTMTRAGAYVLSR